MKKIKKSGFALLVFFLLVCMAPYRTDAASGLHFSAKTANTGAIRVKKITYEGEISNRYVFGAKGTLSELEVDFSTDVAWKHSAKIASVKDQKGKSYRGYLIDEEDDGCDIIIANMKHGRTYTIVVDGIKNRRYGNFGRLTIKVKVPAQKAFAKNIKISKVSVDDAYGEVDVKFAGKVLWNGNAAVKSVKDNKGKSYQGYLTDTDDDDCEIYIENMKYGRTYQIKITGLKMRGASAFKVVTIKVKVPQHRHNIVVEKVEYDEDYEDYGMEWKVNIEFNKDVQYKNSSYVIIRDSAQKAYSSKTSYVEWDEDECEVHLNEGLKIGSVYTYEIKNVKSIGAKKFTTLKGSFRAYK